MTNCAVIGCVGKVSGIINGVPCCEKHLAERLDREINNVRAQREFINTHAVEALHK